MGIQNHIFFTHQVLKFKQTGTIMKKTFKQNTTPFTIAHYILLVIVILLCTSIIAWITITNHNTKKNKDIPTDKNTPPCIQRITNTVGQMWAFNPQSVPEKYWNIAIEYLNQPIKTRTYGICQDVAFVCNVGQIRRDCDPCAVPDARAYAMGIHIDDLIRTNCAIHTEQN